MVCAQAMTATADPAVFRPLDGNWYEIGSSAGLTAVHFGTAGDRRNRRESRAYDESCDRCLDHKIPSVNH